MHDESQRTAPDGLIDATPWLQVEIQDLSRARTRSLRCQAGERLRVLEGRLWVTCEGEHADQFLSAGQTLVLGPGRVVLEADRCEQARFQLLAVASGPQDHAAARRGVDRLPAFSDRGAFSGAARPATS